MKKWLLLIIMAACLFSGCSYKKNAIGKWESQYFCEREYRRNTPPRYYTIGSYYYVIGDDDWRWAQISRYDRLFHEAIEAGKNPHWYIDQWFNEGEAWYRN